MAPLALGSDTLVFRSTDPMDASEVMLHAMDNSKYGEFEIVVRGIDREAGSRLRRQAEVIPVQLGNGDSFQARDQPMRTFCCGPTIMEIEDDDDDDDEAQPVVGTTQAEKKDGGKDSAPLAGGNRLVSISHRQTGNRVVYPGTSGSEKQPEHRVTGPSTQRLQHQNSNVSVQPSMPAPPVPGRDTRRQVWEKLFGGLWGSGPVCGPFEIELPQNLPFEFPVWGQNGSQLNAINTLIDDRLRISWAPCQSAPGASVAKRLIVGFSSKVGKDDAIVNSANHFLLLSLWRQVRKWCVSTGRQQPPAPRRFRYHPELEPMAPTKNTTNSCSQLDIMTDH